jgi:hypothetical protein
LRPDSDSGVVALPSKPPKRRKIIKKAFLEMKRAEEKKLFKRFFKFIQGCGKAVTLFSIAKGFFSLPFCAAKDVSK